jgi:hypothetical protein
LEEDLVGNDPTEKIYKARKNWGDPMKNPMLFLVSNGGKRRWGRVEVKG